MKRNGGAIDVESAQDALEVRMTWPNLAEMIEQEVMAALGREVEESFRDGNDYVLRLAGPKYEEDEDETEEKSISARVDVELRMGFLTLSKLKDGGTEPWLVSVVSNIPEQVEQDRATLEAVFGAERLAEFMDHVQNDPEARAHLAASGSIILDAIDGSGGEIAAFQDEASGGTVYHACVEEPSL